MIKVLPIRGPKAMQPWNIFQQLMLGVSMLPEYSGEKADAFYKKVQAMPDAEQSEVILKAINLVTVSPEDMMILFSFCADKHGVPYSSENIKNLEPAEMIEMIFCVCKEIANMRCYFINEDEKKK